RSSDLREHWDDWAHRPREDDADLGDHEGAAHEVQRGGGAGLRDDRQCPGGAGAGDHDCGEPRGVRDGEAALRAHRLSGARGLHQEHDHGGGADGRGDSRGGGERRADAADAGARAAGAAGERAEPGGVHEQGGHGGRPGDSGPGGARGAELLKKYQFPGDDIPGGRGGCLGGVGEAGGGGGAEWIGEAVEGGSAVGAMEKPEDAVAAKCIWELMEAVDSYIPTPPRAVDKPFLMPIEDIFTITGRGTVVTGRVERGIVKVGEEVEIVGMQAETKKSVVTGVEMFRKLLDEGQAGDNIGALLRGIDKDEVERGQVLAKPNSIKPHKKFKAEVYVLGK